MDHPTEIVYLDPRELMPSRQNVRSDPGDLAGLAETIREHGILQPLGVVGEREGYRIVYGHRRRDAAIVVGLDRVPCLIVWAPTEADVLTQQVLENLQRLDLNDMDKALAFDGLLRRLVDQDLNQSEALGLLARTLGLSSRQIQRYLRLLQLSPATQRLVAQGELGVTHGQHLVGIRPDWRQEEAAGLAVEEGLSASELSRLCAALRHNANIDVEDCLGRLRRGEHIAAIEERRREGLAHLSQAPARGAGAGGEAGQTERDDGDDGVGPAASSPRSTDGGPVPSRPPWEIDRQALEPSTRDGNRVRRIHSLDAFMDELQRLAVCVQEGDLQRMLGESESASVKVRLAARQLRFLSEAVTALVRS